jgi:hypothetical protein
MLPAFWMKKWYLELFQKRHFLKYEQFLPGCVSDSWKNTFLNEGFHWKKSYGILKKWGTYADLKSVNIIILPTVFLEKKSHVRRATFSIFQHKNLLKYSRYFFSFQNFMKHSSMKFAGAYWTSSRDIATELLQPLCINSK